MTHVCPTPRFNLAKLHTIGILSLGLGTLLIIASPATKLIALPLLAIGGTINAILFTLILLVIFS